MVKNEMIIFIKKAFGSGVSANKIEPERKGRTLGGLKDNPECLSKCSESKIQSMYENARKALEAPTPLPKKAKGVSPKASNLLSQKKNHSPKHASKSVTQKVEIIERLERMESRFQGLEERFWSLQVLIESMPQMLPQAITPKEETINGWRFRLLPKKTGQYTYRKWYAMKRLGGKTRKVYLGNNTDGAEAKIQAWLENHPELKEEGGFDEA